MNNHFSPTVHEVLNLPFFHPSEVIAGLRGVSRPVRWTHILETPEGTPFLQGGELILSTGAGFGENSSRRLAYLLDLVKREAAGLCIELGSYMPTIPQEMKEAADHHEFPLIIFTQPVRFVDITQNLHETIVYRHVHAMRKLEEYSRHIQKLTLESQSIHKVLQYFQGTVHCQTFFLHTDQTALYSPAMSQSTQNEMTGILNQLLLSNHHCLSDRRCIPITGQKQVLFHPIMAMGQVFAYLGLILFDREPDHFLFLTLDYTASAMAQLLLRKMYTEERFLDNQSRLLDDILERKLIDEEQIRAQIGIQPNFSAYASIIMEFDPSKMTYHQPTASPFDDVQGIFRNIFARHGFRVLLRSRGYRLYAIAIPAKSLPFVRDQLNKTLLELNTTFHQVIDPGIDLRAGIGRFSKKFADAPRHFQEAEQALSFQSDSSCCFFEDMGIYRMLMQMDKGYALPSFIQDYLQPLLKHDQEQGSDLLLTLKVFFESNLSKQDAASRLFIRRQTLYQRLEKIEELLGEDFLTPHHRLCLELAIRAHDWLHSS